MITLSLYVLMLRLLWGSNNKNPCNYKILPKKDTALQQQPFPRPSIIMAAPSAGLLSGGK